MVTRQQASPTISAFYQSQYDFGSNVKILDELNIRMLELQILFRVGMERCVELAHLSFFYLKVLAIILLKIAGQEVCYQGSPKNYSIRTQVEESEMCPASGSPNDGA